MCRSLYRAGSLTIARELAECKLDLMAVQEVRWEGNVRFYVREIEWGKVLSVFICLRIGISGGLL
jgi:hypothetical protein